MTVTTLQKDKILDLVAMRRLGDAVNALGSAWPGLAVDPGDRAPDVLFCVGVLNTQIGFAEQNPSAQETAKNCLSRASRSLKGDDKDLCDIQLAITYWRAGDEDESLIQLNQILERDLNSSNLFKALYAKAVVLGSVGRHKEEFDYLSKARPLLECVSISFRGKFHTEVAYNLQRLGGDYIDVCLGELTAALVFFEECGAEASEAIVRNNLAGIYRDAGEFKQAHAHVEKAIEIGTRLREKSIIAQCHDLQAQIFLVQGQPVRAAQCSFDSIRLVQGLTTGWAIDCRVTYAKALARTGDARAVDEFSIAVQTARRQENRNKESDAALTALEELDLDVALMLEWFPLADRCEDRKRVSAVRRKLASKLEALSDYEDVKVALIEHQGNITHAARALGYSHHTGLLTYLNRHPELRIRKPYRRSKR